MGLHGLLLDSFTFTYILYGVKGAFKIRREVVRLQEIYRGPCHIHGLFFYGSFFHMLTALDRSRDSVVGIATVYWLDDLGVGVRVPVGSRIFSSPRRPYWLWHPPSILSNAYRGIFLLG
jgi:hypothetical protein